MSKKRYQKPHKTGKIQLIYGLHAVRAALLNCKRVHEELYITENNKQIDENLRLKVPKITILDHKEFKKLHGEIKSNQGIVLRTNDFERSSLQQFIKNEDKKNKITKEDISAALRVFKKTRKIDKLEEQRCAEDMIMKTLYS